MPDHESPDPSAADPDSTPWDRRRLLMAAGIGVASLVPVSGVLGRMSNDDDAEDAADDAAEDAADATEHAADDAADATEHAADDAADATEDAADDAGVVPEGTIPAGSTEVQIVDDDMDGFQPGTVTIDIGGSVTWVNLDDDAHTATGLGFDTGIMRPGALQTVTFEESGAFPYSCQIHPMMVGRVEVRGANGRVTGADDATPGASPGASPVASPGMSGAATVSIADLAFDPPRLEVVAGTTVTWTNDEAIPHTVTSADGTLDSDVLEWSDTVSHTFDTAGTFDYACAIHPSMTATVLVTD